jgi:hypothetical protein
MFVISAIIQIWAVLGIRKFMNQSGQTEEKINMKTLLLHSFTFSLYAISVVVNLVFNILAAF